MSGNLNNKQFSWRSLGPGLLLASSAIGTSHLVLTTRAGAHHGMIFLFIILGILILKYPFYDFSARYTAITGKTIISGYQKQGNWAVYLFIVIIVVNMFAVTAAIGAVCAGLLSTMFGMNFISVPLLSGIIILSTMILLLKGGYTVLDIIIKVISAILLITVLITFLAVLVKGPVYNGAEFISKDIFKGTGLILLISLLGWMPAGMEASAMHSIWIVEKNKLLGNRKSIANTMLDFKFGYFLTTILAVMFLVIGSFSIYGSGLKLDGNATQFSNKLLNIFVSSLGDWSYYVFAFAAFFTIYGTLIAIMDAFPRCMAYGLIELRNPKEKEISNSEEVLSKTYRIVVVLISIGGFCLYYFSALGMIQMLEFVTILSFVLSPVIAYLNLKAATSLNTHSHGPSRLMFKLAWLGLILMVAFAIYYIASRIL